MKILHPEHGGLVIYHKKLERGVLKLPIFDEDYTPQAIQWQDLMIIVKSVKPKKRFFKKQ